MSERISFEVHDKLAGDNRAVIPGSLASRRTSRLLLTVTNGEIVCFQMLEDSFAVSQAPRG